MPRLRDNFDLTRRDDFVVVIVSDIVVDGVPDGDVGLPDGLAGEDPDGDVGLSD